MKKVLFILMLLSQIFISNGNAEGWFTASIGTGMLGRTKFIGGNYFLNFKANYIFVDEDKETFLSPFVKAGVYMGIETMKMRALDARNISRDLNISTIDFGAIWNLLGSQYISFRVGYAAPISAELEGTGDGDSAGFIYGGIIGLIHKNSIVIEFGVDEYFASGIMFGSFEDNSYREIDFDNIRISVSIHYILNSK